MNISKVIHAPVGGGRYTETSAVIKEDHGLYLKIEGVDLPPTYEVDFSNDENSGSSVTMIGNSDGVLIPSQFIKSGKDVFAFLYHVGADFGRTVYKFRIPNKLRPDRTNEQPTPEEQTVIDQNIAALNTAVAQTAQDVIDADASAQSASTSAQSASVSAEEAEEARDEAFNASVRASGHEFLAKNYAEQASASATASAQSAQSTSADADRAEQARDTAEGFASVASTNASESAQSAVNALTSARMAEDAKTSAQTSAQTASAKASEASTSASTASTKASESAQSASQALTYKTDAESAKTASQTAQGIAERAKADAITAKTDAESARDEAQDLVDGISGKVEQIDQNTADIASLEDDRYKPYPTDTASGAVASFTDGADGIPLKSLVVDIDPVQDLHGYDSPWVAGGGKNLLNPELVGVYGGSYHPGVTCTYENDVVTLSGTPTQSSVNYGINILFYADNSLSGKSYHVQAFDAVGTPIKTIYGLRTESEKSVAVVFDTVVNPTINVSFKLCVSAESQTSWTPYENICPISGWTGMQLTQANENLIPESLPDNVIKGTLSNSKIVTASNARIFAIPIPKNTPLHIQKISSDTSDSNIGLLEDGKPQVGDAWLNNKGLTNVINQDYPANGYSWMGINASNLQVTEEWFTTRELMVSVGNTRKDYVAPKGYSTRHISWQTEVGTVFGGSLDVLSGVMMVDLIGIDLSTVTNVQQFSASGQYPAFAMWYSNALSSLGVAEIASSSADFVGYCDTYPILPYAATAQHTDYNVSVRSDGSRKAIYVRTDGTTDVTPTGYIYLKRAEPITYQLTPHEVNSLLGQNNIFADTGDSSVEYRADTKLYIEKLTQPEEDDMIANSAITSGQFFMIGNTLYRALANIASGATITVGTNAQRVSLSDALNLVNA